MSQQGDATDLQICRCQVCHSAVEVLTSPDAPDLAVHQAAWRLYDHEPVPGPGEPDPLKCDFCSTASQPLVWAFHGSRVELKFSSDLVRDIGGIWGSCATCAGLIERGDLERLLNRCDTHNELYLLDKDQRTTARLTMLTIWINYLDTVTEIVWIDTKRNAPRN